MVSNAIAGVDEWIDQAGAVLREAGERVAAKTDLIDPDGGPDEEDPELHPDPTADDPPFGDRELDDEYPDE